mgnify:CR=1 FL=1
MRPTIKLFSAETPDGLPLDLYQHDEEFFIQQGRNTIMSSRAHASEDALAQLGCSKIKGRKAPVVLIGGLGLGFTLRAALDVLPKAAKVVVAEILEPVIEWNQNILGHLAGHPLKDKRVELVSDDVTQLIATSNAAFDAILLDVDNGPEAPVVGTNINLYSDVGLAICRNALRSGGVMAVWSMHQSKGFTRRLEQTGFAVEEVRCRPHGDKGSKCHLIWVAQMKKNWVPTRRSKRPKGNKPKIKFRKRRR